MSLNLSDFLVIFWGLFSLIIPGLVVLTLVKLLIVLVKANRFMDEVRDYIRRQG